MSRRDNPVTTYLSDDEKQDLKRFVEQSDDSQATVVRNALLEYLDFDRYDRIEDKVRDMDGKLDRVLRHLSDDTTHTHKGSPTSKRGTSATEKVRKIADRILSNHGEVIKADDVDRAIEDYAGADDRTLRKYKGLLRKRGLLFEHPSDQRPLWTHETDRWTDWIETYYKSAGPDAVDDYLEAYPASSSATPNGIAIDTGELKQ